MAATHTCPLPRSSVIDLYFLEHRAKLLDIAAFLDRVERAAAGESGAEDFRIAAMNQAIGILVDGKGDRARRVQLLFSDTSAEPIEHAPMKGALGAAEVKR
jgi:hypothetical protein